MTIELPPELAAFVEQELASGQYQTQTQIVCQGLMLLQRKLQLDELRGKIQEGIDELDRGEGIRIENEEQLEAFFNDIGQRGRQRLQAKENGE